MKLETTGLKRASLKDGGTGWERLVFGAGNGGAHSSMFHVKHPEVSRTVLM